MPSNPEIIYKHDGWQGYGHWLGTGNVASKDKQFLPFWYFRLGRVYRGKCSVVFFKICFYFS